MSTDMKTSNKYMSLAAITLAFSFTFLSRYIWSPLMADVSGEFGINATQAGLYMSAFFAGYLVTQIPGGIMADRYQPKYILIACTILGGAMTALMSRITSYEMGLVSAFRHYTGTVSGSSFKSGFRMENHLCNCRCCGSWRCCFTGIICKAC